MENYSFGIAWSVDDGEYVATSPEFPGLSGLGPTVEDAVRELRAAMEVAVEALAEDGEPIPTPRVVQQYSGQLRLRLPRSLHAAAVERAEEEGVSLNALLQSYIAGGLGVDRSVSPLAKLEEEVRQIRMFVAGFGDMPAHRFEAPAPPVFRHASTPREHVRYHVPHVTDTGSGMATPMGGFFGPSARQKTTLRPEGWVSLLPKEALQ